MGVGGPAGARGTTVSTATGVPDQNNQPSGRLAQLNEKADVTIEQQEAGGAYMQSFRQGGRMWSNKKKNNVTSRHEEELRNGNRNIESCISAIFSN